MGKSICLQKATRYRLLAESARSETYRSMLLTNASEWEALADAAATRPRHRADHYALNATAADHSEAVAAGAG